MTRLLSTSVVASCLFALLSTTACTAPPVAESTYIDPSAAEQSTHPELPQVASGAEEAVASGLPEVAGGGAVYTPAVGTAERTALMNAARGAIGTSSKFEVLQLASDGAWAVGVLRPVGSKSVYAVALRNEVAAGWNAFWTGTTAEAAGGAISNTDGRLPGPVITAVDMAAGSSKAGSSKASAASASAAKAPSTKAEIARLFLAEVGADAGPARTTHLQRSKSGVWWGAGTHDGPVDGGYFIVVQRRGGGWDFIGCGTTGPVYDDLLEDLPPPLLDEMRAAGAVW